MQLNLFGEVRKVYQAADGEVGQDELYAKVAKAVGIDVNECVESIGNAQQKCNTFKRAVRWCQQSLKDKRLIERVGRAKWRAIGRSKEQLIAIEQGKSILAVSTKLGLAICAKAETVFDQGIIDEDIHLVLTSLPYPLNNPRLYGGPSCEREWVDFVMGVLEPLSKRLADGASLVLNVGVDCFVKGEPTRKLHIERLVLALDDCNLKLIDRVIWESNKIPSPYYFACKEKKLLLSGYEMCLWLTNNPKRLMSNNQRVLKPHSKKHVDWVEKGGNRKVYRSGDGANDKRVGAFSTLSAGKIPTNVINIPNTCARNRKVNKYADSIGVVRHGAKFPIALAKFWIEFLTEEGQLVVDPMAGTLCTGDAAEQLNRRWVNVDYVWDYIRQGFVCFSGKDVYFNPDFLNPPIILTA